MEITMGRGLSKLQQWMLVRALDGADRGRDGTGGCDLTMLRALSEFYGMPLPKYLLERHNLLAAGKVFSDPGDVLCAKSHRPAVSRAMHRLQQRGLVECVCGAMARWSGINITAAGRTEAERLKASDTGGEKRIVKPTQTGER
jgi:hypothetical protein